MLPKALQSFSMKSEDAGESIASAAQIFSAADLGAILRQRGWLQANEDAAHVPLPGEGRGQETDIWLGRAALLLGPHAADREALGRLLDHVFRYDASTLLR